MLTFFVVGLFSLFLILYYVSQNRPYYLMSDMLNGPQTGVQCNAEVIDSCRTPTLTQRDCLADEYYHVPRYNGSYIQRTNNYKHLPGCGTCPCNSRGFEVCPMALKTTERCYRQGVKKLGL